MRYIESFYLPSFKSESSYTYPTLYPFGMFSKRNLFDIHFQDITIFYGGNGSGKSTLLNIINKKLGLIRKSSFYSDDTFKDYVDRCRYKLGIDDEGEELTIPNNSKIIASEDIINYILSIREKNINSDKNKKRLEKEHESAKFGKYKFNGLDDYDDLVKLVEARSTTRTKYVEKRVSFLKQFSNGESVLKYFDIELENDGIYLLDEPENCLSVKFQIELLKLIVNCSRYCGCQFIIATHSPFLLSIQGAKIYNLDSDPVDICEWTELENVRLYYEFFKKHKDEFE